MSEWSDPFLKELFLSSTPLIDVRAPIEYSEGSLPHSVNLPIMNDEERRLVGTCYKEHGQAAAIKLGHELVSGLIKETRIKAWLEAIKLNPKTEVFCFRGGLRSQISCQWLKEAGVERQPIPGGYKRMRRFFLSTLEEAPLPQLIRLGGLTGSGKTLVLQKISHFIDLEKLASHRGSAFGEQGIQPGQVRFENELALKLLSPTKIIVVEDESAVIGKITLPKRFYLQMRNSPIVVLKADEEARIKNIFNDYVLHQDWETLSRPLERIARGLGGLRLKEVQTLMKEAFEKEKTAHNHAEWIGQLLHYYYDPFYEKDMKRQPGKIIFEGSEAEVLDYVEASLMALNKLTT